MHVNEIIITHFGKFGCLFRTHNNLFWFAQFKINFPLKYELENVFNLGLSSCVNRANFQYIFFLKRATNRVSKRYTRTSRCRVVYNDVMFQKKGKGENLSYWREQDSFHSPKKMSTCKNKWKQRLFTRNGCYHKLPMHNICKFSGKPNSFSNINYAKKKKRQFGSPGRWTVHECKGRVFIEGGIFFMSMLFWYELQHPSRHTTSEQRYNDVVLRFQRCNNVHTTSF